MTGFSISAENSRIYRWGGLRSNLKYAKHKRQANYRFQAPAISADPGVIKRKVRFHNSNNFSNKTR